EPWLCLLPERSKRRCRRLQWVQGPRTLVMRCDLPVSSGGLTCLEQEQKSPTITAEPRRSGSASLLPPVAPAPAGGCLHGPPAGAILEGRWPERPGIRCPPGSEVHDHAEATGRFRAVGLLRRIQRDRCAAQYGAGQERGEEGRQGGRW